LAFQNGANVSGIIPRVVDEAQLTRIESVHRGFFYQHLYAVGCLLLAPNSGAVCVLVERDEDIEILFEDRHLYVQVKNRKNLLHKSDIASTLERFDGIRADHNTGKRTGMAEFIVVSNVDPGPKLLKDIASNSWSPDVSVQWPSASSSFEDCIPPSWATIEAAFQWCVDRARGLRYSRLSAETLILKLAASVNYASTGLPPWDTHQIWTRDLPSLFEQMVIQLHDFPALPEVYRPQISEPDMSDLSGSRLIVGLSGSGKTAWAAQAARLSGNDVAYFDVGAIGGADFHASLVRELAARLLSSTDESLSSILSSNISGTEALRALNLVLEQHSRRAVVFADNVHLALAAKVKDAIQATPNITYVLLSQPWPQQVELEMLLGIRPELLQGWSTDMIAMEFSTKGCKINPSSARGVHRLTGGLPLYVREAAFITRELHGGDTTSFCDHLNAQTHTSATAQEVILSRVTDALTPIERDTFSLMGLADVPLTLEEIGSMLGLREATEVSRLARTLRKLASFGIVQAFGTKGLQIHDAFQLIATDNRASMVHLRVHSAQVELQSVLERSLTSTFNLRRLRLYLRLLPETGRMERLVGIIGDEFVYEYGLPESIREIIEHAVNSDVLSPEDRFWALDALAFWDFQDGNLGDLSLRVSAMEELLPSIVDGQREALSLMNKSMVLCAAQGDIEQAKQIFNESLEQSIIDSQIQIILRHNFANVLYEAGLYEDCRTQAEKLLEGYFQSFGLKPQDILGKSSKQLATELGELLHRQDQLKHLADAFILIAAAVWQLHGSSRVTWLYRMQAAKLFGLAGAYSSLVRSGLDIVDDFVSALNDPEAAREYIETSMLPAIDQFDLSELELAVRGQYAVVLAFCGQHDRALLEIERLGPFEPGIPEKDRAILERQRRIVLNIVERERD
jgi:tetratricopeptide (TPR) repeat protein